MDTVRDPQCDICRLVGGANEANIFSTDYWNVAVCPDQLYLGRVYITSLYHIETFEELGSDQVLDWHSAIKQYSAMVKNAFGADLVTVATLMNNAFQVDPPHPHVHSHVRPRYRRPVNFAGTTFVDECFGHHHVRDQSRVMSADFLFEVAKALLDTI